jgi:hypothetical protein
MAYFNPQSPEKQAPPIIRDQKNWTFYAPSVP